MQLKLNTENIEDIAIILALANRLNIMVEKLDALPSNEGEKENIKSKILNFKALKPSTFGDASSWQSTLRDDREMPFL